MQCRHGTLHSETEEKEDRGTHHASPHLLGALHGGDYRVLFIGWSVSPDDYFVPIGHTTVTQSYTKAHGYSGRPVCVGTAKLEARRHVSSQTHGQFVAGLHEIPIVFH